MPPPSALLPVLILALLLLEGLLLTCLLVGLGSLTPTPRLEAFPQCQAAVVAKRLPVAGIRVIKSPHGTVMLVAVTLGVLLLGLGRANEPGEALIGTQPQALHKGLVIHTLSPRQEWHGARRQ
jgi:hypothetical protein